VGGRRKRSPDEGSNAAGYRELQVRNAKTSGKSADTGKDLLKAKGKSEKPKKQQIEFKTKRSKTNNKKSINNKRKK
jgi:hypothetical protein